MITVDDRFSQKIFKCWVETKTKFLNLAETLGGTQTNVKFPVHISPTGKSYFGNFTFFPGPFTIHQLIGR